MTYVYLDIRPGIDVEKTPLLNMGGYSTSSGVRFFQGMLQKCGGWQQLTATPIVGTARGMHAWADVQGNPYLAVGTEQRLEVFQTGVISDITPIRQTDNPAVNFSTVNGQPTVTIVDPSNGAMTGDWANFTIPVSVGGLVVQGFQQVTVIDANTYTITSPSNATATVNNGGAVPLFTSTITSANVRVTLNNHGLFANSVFNVAVPTPLSNFLLSGGYTITSVVDANNFIIQPGGTALTSTSAYENGGLAQIQYLISSGPVSAFTTSGSGYGVGIYSVGPYGVIGTVTTPLRQWFLDHFGQDLIGNYNGSPIYLWQPQLGVNNPAIAINTTNFPGAAQPPTRVNVSFMSAPQQQLIALGCDTPGTGVFNPLLVRWCNSGDFTDWQATSTNQAGSYPISSGSRLVGGISAPNFTVIWTDVDMWLMNYLGGSGLAGAVWGFVKVTGSPGLLSARSCVLLGNIVYFAAPNGFFAFDGVSLRPIPCTVWDKIWFNLNRVQIDKVNAQANSWFREVSWAFPSASGSGECDQRITLNVDSGTWTYDSNSIWARTAWIDESVFGAPVGADLNKLLVQHETTNDANGAALSVFAQTGWFAVSEGTLLTLMERLVTDGIVTGGGQQIFVTVFTQDYPDDPNMRTYGPFAWVPGQSSTLWSIVNARGRFMSVQFSSTGTGVFWRIGRQRYNAKPAGRRP